MVVKRINVTYTRLVALLRENLIIMKLLNIQKRISNVCKQIISNKKKKTLSIDAPLISKHHLESRVW